MRDRYLYERNGTVRYGIGGDGGVVLQLVLELLDLLLQARLERRQDENMLSW